MKKELKIFVIGDFHGAFPRKIFSIIKKYDPDVIVSTGDFCGNKELIKLFFKYSYGTGRDLSEFVGKRKLDKLETGMVNSGINVLKKLNKLGRKVIIVTGNQDSTDMPDVGHPGKKNKYSKKFNKEVKKLKNIKRIDFKHYDFEGYNFVGYPRSSYPGLVTKTRIKFLKSKGRLDKSISKHIRKINEDNKRFYRRLKNNFRKDTIFVSHNCPYNTKLDKIGHGPQRGEHYGSFLVKKLIRDLKPALVICGHIHESKGKIKLGRTPVVNSGAIHEGRSAIVIMDNKKRKVKSIKLLR